MIAMSITPMHEIKIIHSWEEIERTWSETGSATIVEKCQHCGTERRGLLLDQKSGPSLDDSGPMGTSTPWGDLFEKMGTVARSFKEMFDQLAHDAGYDTIDNVIDEIEKRCQGVVDASNMPYWQLQRWLSRPRGYKVQSLLEFLQGPACNRCDRTFSRTVQPTLDHINGDRSNAHPSNLQLLCKECNGNKGNNPPNEYDKSPFTNEGTPCEHKLTCVELHALQSDCENDEEELA